MAGKSFKALSRYQALFIPSRTFHLRQEIRKSCTGTNVARTTDPSFTVDTSLMGYYTVLTGK